MRKKMIDCSKTENYLVEKQRMTEHQKNGDYCYLCEYEYKFCPNCGAKMDKE